MPVPTVEELAGLLPAAGLGAGFLALGFVAARLGAFRAAGAASAAALPASLLWAYVEHAGTWPRAPRLLAGAGAPVPLSTDWVLHGLLAAGCVELVVVALPGRLAARRVAWCLRAGLALALPRLLLDTYVEGSWGAGRAAAWTVGAAALVLSVQAAGAAVERRLSALGACLAWSLTGGALAQVALLYDNLLLAQLWGTAALAGVLALAVALPVLRLRAAPAGLTVLPVLLVGLSLDLHHYAMDPPEALPLALAALAPAGLLAGLAGPASRPRLRLLLGLAGVAVLVGLAFWLSWLGRPEPAAPGSLEDLYRPR